MNKECVCMCPRDNSNGGEPWQQCKQGGGGGTTERCGKSPKIFTASLQYKNTIVYNVVRTNVVDPPSVEPLYIYVTD